MTLIEILVCLFLFALFTTMVATATVTAYRNYHVADDRLVFYRGAVNAIDRMTRRLAVTQQIYQPANWNNLAVPPGACCPCFPSVSNLGPLIPKPLPSGTPLIFSYWSEQAGGGPRKVGYGWDQPTGNLWEYTYVGDNALPAHSALLAQGIATFSIVPEQTNSWPVLRFFMGIQVQIAQDTRLLPVAGVAVLRTVGIPKP